MEGFKSPSAIASSRRVYEENPHGPNLNLYLAMHRLISFPIEFLVEFLSPLHFMAELGFYYSKENKQEYIRCKFCAIVISREELMEYLARGIEIAKDVILQRKNRSNCIINAIDSKNIPMGKYIENTLNFRFEAHRLYSLLKKTNWQYVGPFSLAKSGFYYTGDQDNVRCVFCNLEVRGWEEGDTADREHRRWNPNCPFLCNRQSVQNIEIGSEQTEVQHDAIGNTPIGTNPFTPPEGLRKYGQYVQVLVSTTCFLLTALDLNIQDWCKPSNTRFVTLKSRLDSFSGFWPKNLRQNPHDLACAGFFYTGRGDRVICFHCNLGLKDWDPNDDPFIQHCKWNSNCQYLLMRKGHTFIKNVLHGSSPNIDISDPPISRGRGDSDLRCLKCRLCNVSKVNLPCGHVTFCNTCSNSSCIICDGEIIAEIKLPGFTDEAE
ncbi:baculoviral IAP repeat-containing protein 7-B-like [Cloeon dipterum]|uniref:baculoviral IAP repeat-containing protein 7-B-like n=1 Tax=Cloeon dipterum TaxID=197152 RepID=UPI00321F97AA